MYERVAGDHPFVSRSGSGQFIHVDWRTLETHIMGKLPDKSIVIFLRDSLKKLDLLRDDGGHSRLHMITLRPLSLARLLLFGVRTDALLRFFVAKQIRTVYRLDLSPQLARDFNVLAKFINSSLKETQTFPNQRGEFTYIDTQGEYPVQEILLASLVESRLQYNPIDSECGDPKDILECFIETCLLVNYIIPSVRRRAKMEYTQVQLRTNSFDSEFLLANLFGTPTGDSGLDDLFGGSGPILPDYRGKTNQATDLQHLGGRVLVVVGPRGSGKSILAARLAGAVARTGGTAWHIAVEQETAESLYMLESIGISSSESTFTTAATPYEAAVALGHSSEDHGVLVVLSSELDSFSDMFEALQSAASNLRRSGTRLIVIDPVNTIPLVEEEETTVQNLRPHTIRSLSRLKHDNVNILFVLEKSYSANSVIDEHLQFLERIADTVVELSTRNENNYSQRYIEITKSRLQREQRGEHPFSIMPGKGMHVFPSPAAINTRVRARQLSKPTETTHFGFSEIDRVIGVEAIYRGDIISFIGTSNSRKIELCLLFLLLSEIPKASPQPRGKGTISILFTTRETRSMIAFLLSRPRFRGALKRMEKSMPNAVLRTESLQVEELPQGHISPGFLLQYVEQTVQRKRMEGWQINRLALHDLSQWEESSPSVRLERTFVPTLIRLLRSLRITSLLVLGVDLAEMSEMRSSLFKNSDCVLEFGVMTFRGLRRSTVRAEKTRGNRHSREVYEIISNSRTLTIRPTASLLRVDHSTGTVTPIGIRMLMHASNSRQKEYFRSLSQTFRSLLTEQVIVDSPPGLYFNRLTRVAERSALDELQIVQLEEWQLDLYLGGGQYKLGSLHPISRIDRLGLLKKRQKGNREEMDNPKTHYNADGEVLAVPFLQNFSLLVFLREREFRDLKSWEDLAWAAIEFEKANSEGIFFDFPKATAQDYVALYFEILLSLSGKPNVTDISSVCAIREWIRSESAEKAAAFMRLLCRRTHNRWKKTRVRARLERHASEDRSTYRSGLERLAQVDPTAIVSRHWHSTFIEMVDILRAEGRSDQMFIRDLPDGVTIASESYLGILEHSAASDAGSEIVRMMTTADAEESRVRMGIGLPIRGVCYNNGAVTLEDVALGCEGVGAFETIQEVCYLIDKAFRRSSFKCYPQVANALGSCLEAIIEIPDSGVDSDLPYRDIREYFGKFIARADSLQGQVLKCDPSTGSLQFNSSFCKTCKRGFSAKIKQ